MTNPSKTPAEWEQRVLHTVNEVFSTWWEQVPREIARQEGKTSFRDARLEGGLPDTRIVLTFGFAAGGTVSHSYPLWGDFFAQPTNYEFGREDPLFVADIIDTWLDEPLPPDDQFRGEVSYSPGDG